MTVVAKGELFSRAKCPFSLRCARTSVLPVEPRTETVAAPEYEKVWRLLILTRRGTRNTIPALAGSPATGDVPVEHDTTAPAATARPWLTANRETSGPWSGPPRTEKFPVGTSLCRAAKAVPAGSPANPAAKTISTTPLIRDLMRAHYQRGIRPRDNLAACGAHPRALSGSVSFLRVRGHDKPDIPPAGVTHPRYGRASLA